MRTALLDTNIISFFLRGHERVVANFRAYLEEHDQINLSIISYYEVVSGLMHRNASKRLQTFLDFSQQSNVVNLTNQSVTASSEVYADTRAKGEPVDDIDILIAGVALVNDWVVVTNNTKHFSKIKGLEIEDWTK